ncbi:MAG: hypothetical protein JRJ09_08495 [Deltaproteobacteria bacterium]|nr:hypothetical protein [Deltaproteobacteria bacterium]MBW2048552.1 hypothetical protein [Deltaproteobacteria bacterium]MBW2110525.1 hypothetical protein [Deltaproteobacteria bacterium]MBW2352171.1 hypothetical protein [Deltaproteobacteria bacterium]HDZ90774.1 hypothetical protein [Deltaproteobacteria bacterium]
MDETAVLGELEALAHGLGVEIRYEIMEGETSFSPGGMCILRGKRIIFINERSATSDRVKTMVKALKSFDLTGVYLRPALRDLMDDSHEI